MNSTNKFLNLLLFLEIIISFGLGILVEKISKEIDLDANIAVILAIIFVLALLYINIRLLKAKTGVDNQVIPTTHKTKERVKFKFKIHPLLLNTLFVLPIGLLTGIFTGVVTINYFEEIGNYGMVISYRVLWTNATLYEFISFGIALILIFFAKLILKKILPLISFSLGLSAGISSTVLIYRPESHDEFQTILYWGILILISAALISLTPLKSAKE